MKLSSQPIGLSSASRKGVRNDYPRRIEIASRRRPVAADKNPELRKEFGRKDCPVIENKLVLAEAVLRCCFRSVVPPAPTLFCHRSWKFNCQNIIWFSLHCLLTRSNPTVFIGGSVRSD